MNRILKLTALLLFCAVAQPAYSQAKPQTLNIPLSRPGEPIYLEISILSAYIEVVGEDRDDVQFDVSVENSGRRIVTPSGTKNIEGGGYALEVEEDDNRIELGMDWRANKVTVRARVPRQDDLALGTINDGEIVVRNVTGSLELSNTNGPITARGIRGSVIAESINEDIDISFDAIDSNNAMSMSSMNGDLVVHLPDKAGVELHLDNAEGEIYSDFEVDVQPSKPVIERKDRRGGVEVRVESAIVANVNGGGTVLRMKTLNGNIEIKKTNP